MDTIEVKGIRSYGYTGFLAEEKVLGQWFEVDLTIWVDLKPSGMSDDLNDTDGDGLLDAKSVKIYKDGALVKSKWVYDRKY